ncbi:unnamed protein product [Spirodela intermedia]|uniref:Uncharacterized protein n=1 Tax=Spirodela intermedia TaxID=51605 RepID=A0A7I8JSW4_SPIIN|nr:unnamed protein product [Spirodela intermedia]CAA6673214.1 unnamed protein product [Spirodela intermedia]
MGFPRDAPTAVEVVTAAAGAAAAAAAASSSSPSPPTSRPLLLRGKQPRSRHQIPPLRASWANQRLLRCGDGSVAVPASSPAAAPPSRKEPEEAANDGFERIRAKLMDHLREAVGRIELPTVPGEARWKPPPPPAAAGEAQDGGNGEQDTHRGDFTSAPAAVDDPTSAAAAPPPSGGEDLPWKLRRRKPAAACNPRQHHQNPQPAPSSFTSSPAPSPPAKVTSRLRSGAPERREAGLRRRWPKFSVSLTKEEIDEDLYAFTGRRASRRPKKRPTLFPGLWLSEVTLDAYLVADPPPVPS